MKARFDGDLLNHRLLIFRTGEWRRIDDGDASDARLPPLHYNGIKAVHTTPTTSTSLSMFLSFFLVPLFLDGMRFFITRLIQMTIDIHRSLTSLGVVFATFPDWCHVVGMPWPRARHFTGQTFANNNWKMADSEEKLNMWRANNRTANQQLTQRRNVTNSLAIGWKYDSIGRMLVPLRQTLRLIKRQRPIQQ